ncbi:hypothetical protein MCOR28_010141 [Pyricularia oryzae]|nr:hypothetical protein MCOR26_010333 [Pyricularia oryzae]KAI6334259.1 hypothetical protein MCOR28_010141 [Pyricularia oryzae]KAI6501424.1 hypothetical protein MCOR11_002057 [Pyricularia oryzae]KAI6561810.1 hypothetical protein MCOR09_007983 [Pyricularia oryzae]
MKIACLQFAPQVGDVDNNLNRADAVLNKGNQTDLDEVDLLVLPELAFSGYNFKSLQDISPFLEPSGSGISALWARTTALKYNCNVVVGYPEKVDVTPEWPASPEYYNSTLIVNGEGETIANYRKSFLYYVDEKWALEGRDGFYNDYIPGLGETAMGICSDINPYKLEAPWLAFEFAFHVLQVAANLVVISMAWPTDEDQRQYSRMPQEPDMNTITYWVQRLEPLIRAEQQDEIIVVFCNRTGSEEDLTYAGTSAVIGIKGGEVCVYGLLGRGVKELLVVDTARPAFAKLVQRTETNTAVDQEIPDTSVLLPRQSPVVNAPPEKLPKTSTQAPKLSTAAAERQSHKPTIASRREEARRDSPKPLFSPASPERIPPAQASEKRPHIATEKRQEPSISLNTVTIQSPTSTGRRKEKPMSPSIIIPDSAFRTKRTSVEDESDSPTIETPTAPSPTPSSMRPKLFLPTTEENFELKYRQALTPFPGTAPDPRDDKLRARPFIFDGSVTVTTDILTPRTPYLEFFRDSSPQESKFYWTPPEDTAESVQLQLPQNSSSAISRMKSGMSAQKTTGHMPRRQFRSPASNNLVPQQPAPPTTEDKSGEKPAKVRVPTPAETQPPPTVLGSRKGPPSRGPPTDPLGPAAANASLMERSNANFDLSSSPFTHAKRGRDTEPQYPVADPRPQSTSRASIPIAASPSLFGECVRQQGEEQAQEQGQEQEQQTRQLKDEKKQAPRKNPEPQRTGERRQSRGGGRDGSNRPTSSRRGGSDKSGQVRHISRPTSRRGHHDPAEEREHTQKLRSRSLGGADPVVRRVRASDIAAKNSLYGGNIVRPQTSIGHRRDTPPKFSPGYQPKLSPSAFSDPGDESSQQVQRGRPGIARGSSHGPDRASSKTSRLSPDNPFTGVGDDEIIATISRINDGCPVHTTNGGTPAAVVKSKEGILYAVEFAKGVETLAESIIPTQEKDVLTRLGIEGSNRRQSAVW